MSLDVEAVKKLIDEAGDINSTFNHWWANQGDEIVGPDGKPDVWFPSKAHLVAMIASCSVAFEGAIENLYDKLETSRKKDAEYLNKHIADFERTGIANGGVTIANGMAMLAPMPFNFLIGAALTAANFGLARHEKIVRDEVLAKIEETKTPGGWLVGFEYLANTYQLGVSCAYWMCYKDDTYTKVAQALLSFVRSRTMQKSGLKASEVRAAFNAGLDSTTSTDWSVDEIEKLKDQINLAHLSSSSISDIRAELTLCINIFKVTPMLEKAYIWYQARKAAQGAQVVTEYTGSPLTLAGNFGPRASISESVELTDWLLEGSTSLAAEAGFRAGGAIKLDPSQIQGLLVQAEVPELRMVEKFAAHMKTVSPLTIFLAALVVAFGAYQIASVHADATTYRKLRDEIDKSRNEWNRVMAQFMGQEVPKKAAQKAASPAWAAEMKPEQYLEKFNIKGELKELVSALLLVKPADPTAFSLEFFAAKARGVR